MPKVSQSYLDSRRARILDAAIICFSRQGFHRATMHDIVKQSRLSPGAIYNYFDSKEEIIEEIAAQRHAKERALMLAAKNEASLGKALKRLQDAFFGPLKNPAERLRRRVTVQMWAEAQRNPAVLKLVRKGLNEPRKILRDILARAQRRREISCSVDPDAAARFLIAVFHGLMLQAEWGARLPLAPHLRLLDRYVASISAHTK